MSEYRLLQEKGRNEERREFIRLVKEQDREIDKLLGDSVKHVLRAVNKSTDRNGEINRRHFDKHIVFIFAFWATNFTNILVRSNRKATQIAGKEALSSIAIYNNKLYGEMIQASTGVLADRIERSLLTRRVFIDNVTLASRIKTIEKAYIRTVKDILTVGVKEGMSVRQIAFEIDNIIKPVGYKKWVSPFDWFRAARTGAVRGRRAGSVSYNSYRIARTEITETYRRSTVEIHSGKPWIAGFMWHLSSAHEVSCVCEDYDGVVFSGMDDLPTTHPNCYSDDTDVFTKDGWKKFKDCKKDDLFLSLNPKTEDLEWVKSVGSVKYKHKGDMIRIRNKWFDLLVTENHRMFIKTRWGINKFVTPLQLSLSNRIPRSCKWAGKHIKNITIGNYSIDMKVFAEFLGYYLSEGSTNFRGGNSYQILISQFKPESRRVMNKCLNRLPFKVNEPKQGFSIYNKDLGEYLLKFGKASDKYVPAIIKDADVEVIKIFLDAYLLGDGHIRSRKTNFKNIIARPERTYFTISDRMASDLGELILKIGKRPSYYLQKGRNVKHRNGTYKSRDIWRINSCYNRFSVVKRLKIHKERYNGYVYDVQLERNHTLFVRRNGKVCWSGNCFCYVTPELVDPSALT